MRLAAAGLQQVYLTRLEIRLTLAESLGFMRHALRLPVVFFQRRFTGDIVTPGLADGAGGRTDLRRAGDHGRQPADAGRLRRRDAPLRPDCSTVVGVAISRLNLVALQMVEPVAGRPQPGDRADPRPAHGGRDVGDPDHREHQGDRFRVGPARPMDRRPGPDDQRRAGAGLLRRPAGRAAPAAGRA